MAKRDDIPITDPSETEALIQRLKHSNYAGAKVVIYRRPDFEAGDHCPDPLCRGHLYPVSSPAIFIQLTGQPLVGETR